MQGNAASVTFDRQRGNFQKKAIVAALAIGRRQFYQYQIFAQFNPEQGMQGNIAFVTLDRQRENVEKRQLLLLWQ